MGKGHRPILDTVALGMMKQIVPTKRAFSKVFKDTESFNEKLLRRLMPDEYPEEQPSKGQPSKSNRQKYARRIRRRA